MPELRSLLGLILLCVACSAPLPESQLELTADPLEGAWGRLGLQDPNGVVAPSQPGLLLFVDGHYSHDFVAGAEPRPAVNNDSLTVENLLAVFDPYHSNAGSYEVRGDSVTLRTVVAKLPSGMASGAFGTSGFRIVGDTLWLTQGSSGQRGRIANPNTAVYVRLR